MTRQVNWRQILWDFADCVSELDLASRAMGSHESIFSKELSSSDWYLFYSTTQKERTKVWEEKVFEKHLCFDIFVGGW